MKRILKTMGLTMVAILATSAVAVTAAQAENQEHTFRSTVSPTVFTGHNTNNHRFSIGEGEETHFTECKKATFEGTEEGEKRDTVTVTPTYSECFSDFDPTIGSVKVDTNHCAFVFDSDTVTTKVGVGPHATVDIECATGDEIKITLEGLGTSITVGPQTGLHGVKYKNLTKHGPEEKEAVEVEATVSGVTYSCVGVGCFLLEGGGNGSNSTYTGKAVVTGYEDKGKKLEGTERTTPTPESLTEGKQVDVTMETP